MDGRRPCIISSSRCGRGGESPPAGSPRMIETRFTIIDDGQPADVPARVRGDQVDPPPQALERALGWTLKPEGLCRANVCMPVRARASVETPEGVDLGGVAAALGRPLGMAVEAGA